MFHLIAAILFFFAAVGANLIPNPTAWGLVALALGLCFGGGPAIPFFKRKQE